MPWLKNPMHDMVWYIPPYSSYSLILYHCIEKDSADKIFWTEMICSFSFIRIVYHWVIFRVFFVNYLCIYIHMYFNSVIWSSCPSKMMGCGVAEAIGWGFVRFVVPNPRVLQANRVDFGPFLCHLWILPLLVFLSFYSPLPSLAGVPLTCPNYHKYSFKFTL